MVKFTWSPWWGGNEVESDTPPDIATALVALRGKVGGLRAEQRAGVAFKVKSAAVLMGRLRGGLDELGMSAWVVDQDVRVLEVERGTAAFVRTTVRVACQDGSYVDLQGCGHGVDTQDKAAGKASTYAWKDALIKGLDLPDADMDDADDSDAPIPGGPHRKNAAASVVAVTGVLDDCTRALAGCKTVSDVDSLLAAWRVQVETGLMSPKDAAALSPLAKSRKAELAS